MHFDKNDRYRCPLKVCYMVYLLKNTYNYLCKRIQTFTVVNNI